MFTSWADLSFSGVSSSQPTVHMVFDKIFPAAFEKGELHMSKNRIFVVSSCKKIATGLFYHWIYISECKKSVLRIRDVYPG
jgi:hypothetical protein